MWNWLTGKKTPKEPVVTQGRIGEVLLPSGTLLLAEPMTIFDPVRIEGIPPGRIPVAAQLIRYPEGGQRVARVGLLFRPGEPDSRRPLGEIGVDSATVVAVDARVCEEGWKDVGPDRIGHTAGQDHRKTAKLIGKQFGLHPREVNFISSEFDEPISEELEARITAYLQTFPEYAKFTYFHFSVRTNNTFERVQAAVRGRLWGEVVLDEVNGASLLAVSSGFGDGRYTVQGLYGGGELLGAEIEFIGPAQDKVLEAFPVLRY